MGFEPKPEQYTSGDYYFNPDGQRSFNNIAKTAENAKQPFEPDRSFGFAMQMSDTVLPKGKVRAAEAVKVSDAVKMLQEKLNIPVRVGKLGRVGKGVQGWYKARPEIIRTRTADDIRVIAHEIGHHLEKAVLLFCLMLLGSRRSGGRRCGMKQLVLESRGQKVTTSLRIAEKFSVSHKVVMKAIRKALKAGSKDEFLAVRQNLTIPVVGEVKQNKIYLVTREGLLRLAPVLEKDAVLNEFLFAFDGGGTDTE